MINISLDKSTQHKNSSSNSLNGPSLYVSFSTPRDIPNEIQFKVASAETELLRLSGLGIPSLSWSSFPQVLIGESA